MRALIGLTRYLLPIALLCACEVQPGPAGPPGPQGEPGPPGMQGPAGKDGASAKQLRLINVETGDDLGIFVTFGAAWSEKVGGVIYYTGKVGIAYSESGCKGASAMHAAGTVNRASSFIPGPGATLLRPMMRTSMKFHQKSWAEWRDGATKCNDVEADVDTVPYTDTGMRLVPMSADLLDVELR